MGTIDRSDAGPPAGIEARYRALAAELAAIGFVARGSVISATTTCSSKGCHCRLDPARRHGPYWQWTRSVGGVTRTTRLSEAEARRYQELRLLERAGKISRLELQPRFAIVGPIPRKVASYFADFSYFEGNRRVIEDFKGYDTPLSRLKRKLVEAIYGITIEVTR